MMARQQQNGVIIYSADEDIHLEYRPAGPLYHTILWSISVWSMLTNVVRALLNKLNGRRNLPLNRILWRMGRSHTHFSSWAVDRFSRHNHKAKWGAAGWQSLDMFYNYHEKIKPSLTGHSLEKILTEFWFGKMENRQAVSNRMKIVTKMITDAMDRFEGEDEVRVLSVASGSAQAVIQAMKNSRTQKIKATLLDVNTEALRQAEDASEAAGLRDRFTFIQNSTSALKDLGCSFHIIEMVGFLDYRPREKAVNLINKLRNLLITGGVLITCNIAPNIEKIFLDWVLLWPMIYRSADELRKILTEGGFSDNCITILPEPHRIHNIALANK